MSESNSPPTTDLPPSAKLVYRVLDNAEEPLTLKEVCREADLAGSTTRYAIDRLSDEDLIESRPHPSDARKRKYDLSES